LPNRHLALGTPSEEPAFPHAGTALREADRVLLARFALASLLLDDELNIIQVRGETGPYLELASGSPSLNLHRIARPEQLVEIVQAIQQARESGAEVRREGLRIDQRHDLTLDVIPIKRASADRSYMRVFIDGSREKQGLKRWFVRTSSN
jgi:two-component system CheB/CheR fusion protein